MIKINFVNTKQKAGSHLAMQTVADDVEFFNRHLNSIYGADEGLPCPTSTETDYWGFANCSEIWFGENNKIGLFHVEVMTNNESRVFFANDRLKMLAQLVILSLSEQFIYVKFTTDEDFSAAVEMYEEHLGSISANACNSLGLNPRK